MIQQQILAITVIILIALIVPEGVRWEWQRRKSADALKTHIPRWQQWTTRFYVLYTPLIGLVLANVVIWLFKRQGYPNGLIESSRTFFWLWLAYRFLLMVLYARFGKSVKPYHRFVFIPIFLLVLLWLFLGTQIGIARIITVPIIVFGSFSITLGNLISAFVLLYIFLIGAWVVERALNHSLQNRFEAEQGKIRSLATLSRYAISALGIVVSLVALGLDATSLGLVAGGLSVGIGIGMQEIVGNFISGLTLLFEQSLRPGDLIELNGQVTEVERVSLRTTTVTTFDNTKIIVPNSTFTVESLTTLTKNINIVRVVLPLRVAYNTDPEKVRQVVEQAAARHPQVVANPAPLLFFRGIGTDSSLDLDLFAWTDQPKLRGLIRSELYYLLFAELARHSIEIPVPRRDLNLRQGWANCPETSTG
ncbi:MAG TPA: mechanosensitive ion channel [Anaerolineae bacterium]|nr:mechanosensitive ion channel [Anaerolineae bacterium]